MDRRRPAVESSKETAVLEVTVAETAGLVAEIVVLDPETAGIFSPDPRLEIPDTVRRSWGGALNPEAEGAAEVGAKLTSPCLIGSVRMMSLTSSFSFSFFSALIFSATQYSDTTHRVKYD